MVVNSSANRGGHSRQLLWLLWPQANRQPDQRISTSRKPPAFAQRLVPRFPRALPDAGQQHRLREKGLYRRGLGVVGRKVAKALLLGDIYETARSSIGLLVPLNGAAIAMFRMVIAEGLSLIRLRSAIAQHTHAPLADHDDYKRLHHRFRHHRQFLKFCGLDLATTSRVSFGPFA
jgi:hypothetical protein